MSSAATASDAFVRSFAKAHGSGGAAKVPRDGMRQDEAFEKERIYNYHKCFEW